MVGEYKEAGLPDIIGNFKVDVFLASENGEPVLDGCFKGLKHHLIVSSHASSSWVAETAVSFDASYSNSIYGNAETVRPRSVVINFCIKY